MQRAQPRGVRRGDINGDIASVGIDFFHTNQVIIFPVLNRRIFIFTDIDAQHAVKMRLFHVLDQVIDAMVIKAHAVDQPLSIHQTEDPWLIVARLRTRRHGADLNGAKTHRAQRVNAFPVFIQPGRQTQRVFKGQPHAGDRPGRHLLANQDFQRRPGDTA